MVSAIFPMSSHYRVGVCGEVALGRPTLGQVAFPMDGLVALCVSRRRSLRRMTLLSHQRNFVECLAKTASCASVGFPSKSCFSASLMQLHEANTVQKDQKRLVAHFENADQAM